MHRTHFLLVAVALVSIPSAWWMIHRHQLLQTRLTEYPETARPLIARVLSAGDPPDQQEALLSCAAGLSSLSPPERADIYITLLRHRQFDASSAICFYHIIFLDRSAFLQRAEIYKQSSTFASLSESQRTYAAHVFNTIQNATSDNWTGKDLQ